MKIVSTLPLLAVALILSGCDIEQTYLDISMRPIIFFPPLIKLQINDDKIVEVYGFDKCPKDNIFQTFNILDNSCIKVEPDTKEVNVRFKIDQQTFTEKWSVYRQNDGFKFVRPNGFEVNQPLNNYE
ncbi:hypothetical protein AB4455_10145 [Vibrio sp. 10N.261.46.E12]|uniref:hypothetical protein n=1 Tax=unclassified Vibrio TaxID=2614977 RepID=UPI000977F6B7|nr:MULTISPECIES: hypothetical protein [unclassified Vibrio]OMO36174.1 hypothetical protein BH584_05200 [Vibrio sp. 10N.261.45.E1]PMJ34474.1 hypothetical protein BCU27_03335 [Vibrio sp. 10N.286.45.B6]PML88002.1 hypothetical protein BCT66_10405 [Vibrio sp. 10N.261.49.E11]PMM67329.1 hypothetical protein BCT48_14875 [Vibrio sp. 10N.261.46.F12]PMM81787.1 hypothetical protein BCT46_15380 [Vibrio sp. 10N.261.46.E8]